MAELNDTGYKSFVTGATMPKWSRVVLTAGVLQVAGLTDREIGVVTEAVIVSGDRATVQLRTAPGTTKMIAAAAITIGAGCWTAADGECTTSASTAYPIGIVLNASTDDQDIVEVLRFNGDETAV
jgi:hypothetical protein